MITVTAAIMVKDGQVLIGRRKPGLRHAGKWEFPGGKVESDETPRACLKREMKEEFNIQVKVGDAFAENRFSYQRGPIHLMAFRVDWIDGDLRATVHDRIAWVLPADLTSYDLLPADIPFAEKLASRI
jgi:8-oxo-dGTP diphosphatase